MRQKLLSAGKVSSNPVGPSCDSSAHNRLISTYWQVSIGTMSGSHPVTAKKSLQNKRFGLWHWTKMIRQFDYNYASLSRHAGPRIGGYIDSPMRKSVQSWPSAKDGSPLLKRRGLNGVPMVNLEFLPVILENNQTGRNETISSISEAAAFLLNGWPKKRSSLHLEARVACYEAQSGIVSVSAARTIFVEAAIEANIYVGQEPPAILDQRRN